MPKPTGTPGIGGGAESPPNYIPPATPAPPPPSGFATIAELAVVCKLAEEAAGGGLLPESVTTADIRNFAVTAIKVGFGAIGGAQIANGAVTGAKIANETITAEDIANEAIGTSQINNQAVTSDKIASLTIVGEDIRDTTITNAKLVNLTILGEKIANETITQGKLALGAVGIFQISAAAIAALKLREITTKTANYTPTSTDDVIIANGTGGSFTVTLPTAIGIAGRQYIIKSRVSGANVITVATTAGQTIDGEATITLSPTSAYNTITVISDGANWWII